MIMKMPLYCKDFKCIADKCKDNCCVGWEIDIDPSSAEYYDSVGGEFGDRLKSNIEKGEVCSFKLKGERCPFLNDSNLCDIIINLGEDKLCQICDDHPRYYEWYSDVKEGGIGLCCEEAARIIVGAKENFSTYDIHCDDEGCDDYDERLYDVLSFARQEIINALENEELSLKDRIASVLDYVSDLQFRIDNYDYSKLPLTLRCYEGARDTDVKAFLESFRYLEPIDANWQEYLQKLIDDMSDYNGNFTYDKEVERYLKNIAVYFIWRYFLKGVYDDEIISKTFLMALSVVVIKLMFEREIQSGESLDSEKCSLLAKNYSKEIEYSEENLEMLYNMVYENPAFSKDMILSIL